MASYYYDIYLPQVKPLGAWEHIASFPSRREAVDYVKRHFAADDMGNINLISKQENFEELLAEAEASIVERKPYISDICPAFDGIRGWLSSENMSDYFVDARKTWDETRYECLMEITAPNGVVFFYLQIK